MKSRTAPAIKVMVEATDVVNFELTECAGPLVAPEIERLTLYSFIEQVGHQARIQVLEPLVIQVVQLAQQVLRRDETETARLKSSEEIRGLFRVLRPVAPELVEVPSEVNIAVADGGEFAEVARLKVIKSEEAAKLVRPKLMWVEQGVEFPGLEIPAQEEVSEIASKLVGPECIYEQVRREITGIKEFMEFPIGEEIGTTEFWESDGPIKSGASVKRVDTIEHELSIIIE